MATAAVMSKNSLAGRPGLGDAVIGVRDAVAAAVIDGVTSGTGDGFGLCSRRKRNDRCGSAAAPGSGVRRRGTSSPARGRSGGGGGAAVFEALGAGAAELDAGSEGAAVVESDGAAVVESDGATLDGDAGAVGGAVAEGNIDDDARDATC